MWIPPFILSYVIVSLTSYWYYPVCVVNKYMTIERRYKYDGFEKK